MLGTGDINCFKPSTLTTRLEIESTSLLSQVSIIDSISISIILTAIYLIRIMEEIPLIVLGGVKTCTDARSSIFPGIGAIVVGFLKRLTTETLPVRNNEIISMVERQLIISMLISSLFLLLLRLEISLSVPGSLLGSWHLNPIACFSRNSTLKKKHANALTR